MSHIVFDDYVYINDKKEKYKLYKKRITCTIKAKDLYADYSKICLAYKYTPYAFDAFIDNITVKSSGITKTERHKIKCVSIDRDEVLIWVAPFRNEIDEPIGIYDPELEEPLPIDPIAFLDDSDEDNIN